MKRVYSLLLVLIVITSAYAQTLRVVCGNVTYAFTANGNDMNYTDHGETLTIGDKAFKISDISRINIDQSVVEDNSVSVNYNNTSAEVVISGNIASTVSAIVNGAHVTLDQGDVADEVTYELSGSTTNGSLTLNGSYKATVALRGLTLTNPNGAALDIQNGKRIDLSVKEGTMNTLTDGNGSQKACIYCKGHLELKGKGTLNVNGNYAHAIKSGDYMTVKNLTLNINKAVKDGISCNEYFLMQSGNVSITGVGDDGIQTDLDGSTNTGETTNHEEEDSGNIYIDGGTIIVNTTAAGTKGLKADSTIVINDGTLTLNCSGNVDTSDSTDPSYVAAFSCGRYVQNGATITVTINGTAGRGVKAYDIETNGGTLAITNSASPTTISNDVKSAKGLKGLNIALNAGTIDINMSGNASKAIKAGDGTQSTGGMSGGGRIPGWGGGMSGGSSWSNITGSYTQGKADGSGPTLTVTQTGASYSSSSAKGIKAICAAVVYGGSTEVNTSQNGGEGLESKTGIDIRGGQHYLKCYDDCINSAGKITFSGGTTVCYSTGNDAVDSNAGSTGAITIGDGTVLAYTTKGGAEEGLDCDNNSYIQITGKGYAISAGGSQGGGGGRWGGSNSGNTIANAKQGYALVTSSISYTANTYYTLADASGNNLVTYSLPASLNSSLSLFTAKGMVKGSTYTLKSSTTAPTNATTAWHGIYLGSTASGSKSVTSFTAN